MFHGSSRAARVIVLRKAAAAGAGVVPFNRSTMSGGMQQLTGGMRAHHRSQQIVVPELPSGWRRGRAGLCVRA